MTRMPMFYEFEHVLSQILAEMHDPRQSASPAELGVIDVEDDITPEGFSTFGRADGCTMLAVDGGSATLLDAGSFMVAAVRVGSASYRDREYVPGPEPEMHLLHLSASELAEVYSIFFSKTVGGEAPDKPRGMEEALGRIRTLLEWKHLEEALDSGVEHGTVVAFDGALFAGIKGTGDMLARIVSKAGESGVILCGVSKKSMLVHHSRPLIPAIQMAGYESHPDAMWHYKIKPNPRHADKLFGQVHVARFHPRSGYAFRVDLALPPGMSADDAMSRIAYHAVDPTYAGYPYPLARVHNDVAFSRAEVEDLRNNLKTMAVERGVGQDEWHLTFQNLHDVLDMNR